MIGFKIKIIIGVINIDINTHTKIIYVTLVFFMFMTSPM